MIMRVAVQQATAVGQINPLGSDDSPRWGVSSCALQELIGKRETSWTPSPVFEAKATLGEFTSLLGFSF